MKAAISITFIWFSSIAVIVFSQWDSALAMDLNEWGDFLAGTTSPIALFWLVVGYFQQGKELQLNTQALIDQKSQLQRQAELTAELVQYNAKLANATEKHTNIVKSQEWKKSSASIFNKK